MVNVQAMGSPASTVGEEKTEILACKYTAYHVVHKRRHRSSSHFTAKHMPKAKYKIPMFRVTQPYLNLLVS